jgi:hypothetical protein
MAYPNKNQKLEAFNIFIIVLGVLTYAPFFIFFNIETAIKLLYVLIVSFYIISQSNFGKNSNLRLISLFIIISSLYFLYYYSIGLGILNKLIVQIIYIFFMLSIYIYFKNISRKIILFNYFATFVSIVSIITIISFIGSNSGIVPFPKIYLAGYYFGFNYILGGVSPGSFSFRPHYYFSEPSYMGFFLGFAFLFLNQIKNIAYKKTKLIIVFIAGVMVFSTTFYASLLIGIISDFIYKRTKPYISAANLSAVYLIVFIMSSVVYVDQLDTINNRIFSEYSTSFNNRQMRIESSLFTINRMNYEEILFGKGTGYISNKDMFRNAGESNIYIRTLVENGVFVLIIYIIIIYSLLKGTPSLMLYTLVGLHAVILLETPFFILIALAANAINSISKQEPQRNFDLHRSKIG